MSASPFGIAGETYSSLLADATHMNGSWDRTAMVGVGVGAVLVALGVGSYVITGFESPTALIPVVFGVLFAGLGWAVRNTSRRTLSGYAMGLLAALGIAGSLRGLAELPALLAGEAEQSSIAVGSQTAMAVLCLVVLAAVVLAVRGDRRTS